MPRSTINVCLDPTRKIVLLKVEGPNGGFVAPLSPEEAHIVSQKLLVHAAEAEHNRRGGGK